LSEQQDVLPEHIYDALAGRRLQWDGLLWQVPSLSMTAQAFLMTIALGPGSSRTARVVTSILSLVAAFATLQLFASNRRAELADAHLLELHEKATQPNVSIHGESYRDRRNALSTGDWYIDLLCRVRSYRVWIAALTIFALTSVVTLVLAFVAPDLLRGT
jgi:hypothetical protein